MLSFVECISINLRVAGTLASLLGKNKNQIVELTLKGEMNSRDVRTIQSMRKLAVLNLEDVKVVEGGRPCIYHDGDKRVECYTLKNMIADYMFVNCKKRPILKEVKLPKTITSIGKVAFGGHHKLAAAVIPDSVRIIDDEAFLFCSGLKSVVLGKRLSSIGQKTFINALHLKTITLPEKLSKIGAGSFILCPLETIYAKRPIPPRIISNNKDVPKDDVFGGWTGFKDAFDDSCFKTCILYVPKGSKSKYERARSWKAFKNIIEL